MLSLARAEFTYQLLIVELLEDDERMARVLPADFETDELDAARLWADTFNCDEYQSPFNSWAVIRVVKKYRGFDAYKTFLGRIVRALGRLTGRP